MSLSLLAATDPTAPTRVATVAIALLVVAVVAVRMPIQVETSERFDIVDVTGEVQQAIPSDTDDGVCTVFVNHTTAGVVVNEHERRLLDDIEGALETLIPRDDGYAHDELDGNADSHLRTLLLDESVSVPVRDGSLALGTWQSILLVECDGPRTRSLSVTCTS